VAQVLGVRVRTLANWEKQAQETEVTWGRPAHSRSAHFRAALKVRRQIHQQGWTAGWRPIFCVLAAEVPQRLVQEELSRLKRRYRMRLERSPNRKQNEVLAKDAWWVQDATHLGRKEDQKAIQAEVIRDRGSLEVMRIGVGRPANQDEVIRHLEAQKAETGLPLVWGTDRGSQYKGHKVADYLAKEKVIHLKSRPRTPQDNGSAEEGMGELKHTAGLGRGVVLEDFVEAQEKLQAARVRLQSRPRGTKGYQTSVDLRKFLPHFSEFVSREVFYQVCRQAMQQAVKAATTPRQAWTAERQAILKTLEEFGLIHRTQGRRPCVPHPGRFVKKSKSGQIGVLSDRNFPREARGGPPRSEADIQRPPLSGKTIHGALRVWSGIGRADSSCQPRVLDFHLLRPRDGAANNMVLKRTTQTSNS